MDHIKIVRPGNTNLDYTVMFKSFEAAAAFVNRSNEHWLEDQISGQVYATWRPEEPSQSTSIAVLILPKATIEVWRRVALEYNAPLSKYGFPIVDWGRSFESVLQRIEMTLGRDGDCHWYKVDSEYAHRVVIAVCFKNAETLEKFMLLKKEHCLSSPWKDRFFVQGRDAKYETSHSGLTLGFVQSGCLNPLKRTQFLRSSSCPMRRSKNWFEIIHFITLGVGKVDGIRE
jgi:hypothetical protein